MIKRENGRVRMWDESGVLILDVSEEDYETFRAAFAEWLSRRIDDIAMNDSCEELFRRCKSSRRV